MHDETETLSGNIEKDRQEYKRAVDPLSFPMAMRKMTQTPESLLESRDSSFYDWSQARGKHGDTAKATSNHHHKWSHNKRKRIIIIIVLQKYTSPSCAKRRSSHR